MPQWLVKIVNHDDEGVSRRREEVRPAHLKNVKALAEAGNIVAGGALLDESGQAVGSVAMVDFPDRAALDRWLETDPYALGHVWHEASVMPIAIAVRAP